MKLAVVLSGSSRTAEKIYPAFFEYLLKPYLPDVFLHTWTSEIDVRALYRPIDCLIEHRVAFDTSPYELTKLENVDVDDTLATFYSTSKAIELLYNYAREHNCIYEWVVKLHFSTLLQDTIDISSFPEGKIIIPDSHVHPYGYNTDVAIGSEGKMILYGSLYAMIPAMHSYRKEFSGEVLLHQFLQTFKIKVHQIPFAYKSLK